MTIEDSQTPGAETASSVGVGARGSLLRHVESLPAEGEESLEAWRHIGSPVFAVEALEPLPSYRAACEFYDVDGLIFCRNEFRATAYTRQERHLRGGDTDFITLHFPLRGGAEYGMVSERPHRMAPDRICLQDWAHPYATMAEPTEKLGVVIPRDRIVARDWLFERQPTITWMLDSPQGRVLANAWITLWQSLPGASADDATTLAGGFLGLVNGLISPTTDDPQGRAVLTGMQPAMKRLLDARLAEPGLGVDQLVQAFRCSRATVFRIFREYGGVQAYIRDRRLACCFRELRRPSAKPRPIREMARRWGFHDARYFSRLFKQQFGITPSEAATTARQVSMDAAPSGSATADDEIALFHQWLTRD